MNRSLGPDDRVAAVEGGGTKFVCAVLDGDLRVAERAVIPTREPEATLGAVRAWLLDRGPFRALGVGCFGPAETRAGRPDYGRLLATPKPGWAGADVLGALSGLAPRTGFASDVDAAALAEGRRGAGRGLDPDSGTLAYVTVGTGIGVGVARGSSIVTGEGHFEMGHVGVPRGSHDRAGGACPFHGDCLEGLAAGPSIAKRWGAPLSALPRDHEAHRLVAGYLAELCRILFLAHRPGRIVLGGGVMKTDGLLGTVAAETEARLAGYLPPPEGCEGVADALVPPELGDDAGVVGAALVGLGALGEAG
ncbi:ROK family protein [Parvularcula dongshanensis]|uniref:fructokinase n=1 Tax=Parvularcula dongshanensis TaxID=1173995 RepID=A0A840I6J0_9PROT|nr:ROK family protein [Parvularcula dongshanensis]MBB4660072.1 fructokinase [Parvularcula dongshanensis]